MSTEYKPLRRNYDGSLARFDSPLHMVDSLTHCFSTDLCDKRGILDTLLTGNKAIINAELVPKGSWFLGICERCW